MKITVLILVMLGICALGFGYWGSKTMAGKRAFDEMAGMIPLGAAVLGGLLLLAAALLWFFKLR